MGNVVATNFLPTSADQDDGVFVPYRGDGRWRYRWVIRCSAGPTSSPERLQASYVPEISSRGQKRVALGATLARLVNARFRAAAGPDLQKGLSHPVSRINGCNICTKHPLDSPNVRTCCSSGCSIEFYGSLDKALRTFT